LIQPREERQFRSKKVRISSNNRTKIISTKTIMKAYAPAKVNLYLRVLAKRKDGYHDIETIMQTISLYDTLIFSKRDDAKIILSGDNSLIPNNSDNLVFKAAKILKKYTNYKKGVNIFLKKRIPIAAGLGGGSSDAASTLMALNKFWEINLSQDKLIALSQKLGADVPFFLVRGTVLATGTGTTLTPLKPIPKTWLVLIYPKIKISTKWVYNKVKIKLTKNNLDIRIRQLNYEYKFIPLLFNSLEEVVLKYYPLVGEIKKELKEKGSLGVLMSGSGSSVFGITATKEEAKLIYRYFKSINYPVWIAYFI